MGKTGDAGLTMTAGSTKQSEVLPVVPQKALVKDNRVRFAALTAMIVVFVLLILKGSPAPAFAAGSQAAAANVDAVSIQTLAAHVAQLDSRIGDITTVITAFGITVALVIALISGVTLVSAPEKARESARGVAQEVTQQWMARHQRELQDAVKAMVDQTKATFDAEVAQVKAQMADDVAQMRSTMNAAVLETLQQSEQAKKAIQQAITAGTPAKLSEAETRALLDADQRARNKPETQYTATDFMDRAFAAYADGKKSLAAAYFEQAAQAPDATADQKSKALLNAGVFASQQGRYDEALAQYDEVITILSSATEPSQVVRLATALANKAIVLIWLDRPVDAVAVAEDVVKRFDETADETLEAQVARALNAKANALRRLDPNRALAAFDQVIERFEKSSDPMFDSAVGLALLNKSDTLLQIKAYDQTIATSQKMIDRYDGRNDQTSVRWVEMARCNMGEALANSNKLPEAIKVFDGILTRRRQTDDAQLRPMLVEVAFARGVALQWSGKRSEAIAALESIIADSFVGGSNADKRQVQKFVDQARDYLKRPDERWELLAGTFTV
jgi:tetratricopeptide (TPR) repeat protein